MTNLTDHEINQRLAEIVGIHVRDEGGRLACNFYGFGEELSEKIWAPLSIWEQLGPIMVKERISVIQSKQGSDSARAYYPDGKKGAEEADTMRAIALAIIYKHEEE